MADGRHDVIHRQFFDGSEQEGALDGWTQRYVQMGPGQYLGEVRRLCLGGIKVTRESINVATEQRTSPPVGRSVFVQSLRHNAGFRMNAEAIAPESSCFVAGGEEYHAAMPEGCDIVFVEYDAPSDAKSSPWPVSTVNAGAEAAAFASWLLSLLMAFPEVGGDTLEMASLVPGMITDRLSYLRDLATRGLRQRTSASQTDWAVFRLVRDHLDGAGSDPLSVADVCRRIDLPEPVVRQAFINTVGRGPGSWMRDQRLNGARRDLLNQQDRASVSEVAVRWGFWHLGRFSRYYADLFGELPSQTATRSGSVS
ncbi:helix-turn-helix domain-containing protein [Oryzibacter oryziterrae]|uniref:helix-turn-helix domain-containing protein n=1 Tax=Oryzibacter oryziterrae TaxID=2766474 RepID=UPI00272A4AEE|nr:helix-turn-helix domain-containing protein [Oryzibacter oryziterrae]